MANVRQCRACGTARWQGDPCPNAECPRNNRAPAQRVNRVRPISATTKHGFHAPSAALNLVDDYDQPIRSRQWRTIGRIA